jgi:cell division transport system permease protein
VLVVAVALALPFAGLTLLDNVRPMSEQLSVDPEISLFIKPDAPRAEAQALAPQLRQILRQQGVKHRVRAARAGAGQPEGARAA